MRTYLVHTKLPTYKHRYIHKHMCMCLYIHRVIWLYRYLNVSSCASECVSIDTTPHAPYNVSVDTDRISATVSWLPAYDGGHPQHYVLWCVSVSLPLSHPLCLLLCLFLFLPPSLYMYMMWLAMVWYMLVVLYGMLSYGICCSPDIVQYSINITV